MAPSIPTLAKLGATGCGLVIVATAQADMSGGYVYQSPGELDYLTATETDHKLTGYFQTVRRNPRLGPGYSVDKTTFAGEISGANFTLHARFLSFGLNDCSGKFGDGGAKLFVPLSNGQTNTFQFVRSTPERWNKVVAAFEKSCGFDALRQTWRDAVIAHLKGLDQQGRLAQADSIRFSQEAAKSRESISQLEGSLKTATDGLGAAHRARDYTRLEADKMAEIAKNAQREADPRHQVSRGYVGLNSRNLTDAERSQLDAKSGVRILDARADSPGATAGITGNDVIVRVGNSAILNEIDFLYALLKTSPGQTVEVELIRDGKHKTVNVKLGDPPGQPSETLSTIASNLAYQSSQAEYGVSQADYRISQAVYTEQSVRGNLDQARERLQTQENGLNAANELLGRVRNEGRVLEPGKANFKKLWAGSLWIGTAKTAGQITTWPDDDSASYYGYKVGQPLSVFPVSSEWCMVILQNKSVGWARRTTLSVKVSP